MYAYHTPGVYTEWLDTASGIRALRTDIAGFVGITARGPLHYPVRIESWAQFVGHFGRHIPQAYLAYAVQGFFANGGRTCWVVRVADPHLASPAWIDLNAEDGGQALRLTASSPGVWGNRIVVSVVRTGNTQFSLTLRAPEGEEELWRDLSLCPDNSRFVVRVLNDDSSGSRLVVAALPNSGAPNPAAKWNLLERDELMSLGEDGLKTLRPEHFSGGSIQSKAHWGLTTLEEIDEISILAMPDILPKVRVEPLSIKPQLHCESVTAMTQLLPYAEESPEYPPAFTPQEIRSLQQALTTQCSWLKDRVAILDSPDQKISPAEILKKQAQIGHRESPSYRYAALYYPWIRVADPLGPPGSLRAIPPSGHIAGHYAQTDIVTGVHKPPANETLEAIKDLTFIVDDIDHGRLNESGINLIRAYPGRGIRIAGARTLSKEPEWRYINVRRLLIMIEEAIDEQTQWTVFEPNSHILWHDLERTVRGFLHGLWQRGMLDGALAADAFFVRCDESTNPPEEIANGRITCLVGVQPPRPAEFVVVRIGKTEGGTEIVETGKMVHG